MLALGRFTQLGSADELLERGARHAERLELTETDDVVHVALAVFEEYPNEVEQFVREQRGPSTLLKKAVLRAAEERSRS